METIPNAKLNASFTCWDGNAAFGNSLAASTEMTRQRKANPAMLAPNHLLCSIANLPQDQASSSAKAGTAGKM